MLVISWEKHLRTWCTDLVWLRRISLLEDTSIEERNSSCRKCNRTSWDVKSIFYGTYLILAKKQEIRRWRGETSFERRGTSRKKKIRFQRDVRNKSPSEKTHAFRCKRKKRDIRGKRDETSCEKQETRNETCILKNGTSQEMYGISWETWWLTSRKSGNFNKIQSKKFVFFLRRSSGFPWHTRTLFYLKSLKKRKNLLNRNVRPLWVRPLKHEANSRRFSVKCRSRPISMSWGHNPPLMLAFHHLLLSVWPHISWCQERIPPLRLQQLLRAEGWRLTR